MSDTDYKHYSDMPDDTVCSIFQSNMLAALTGVSYATQTNTGFITLTHTDNTTARRHCSRDIRDFEAFAGIIEYVKRL